VPGALLARRPTLAASAVSLGAGLATDEQLARLALESLTLAGGFASAAELTASSVMLGEGGRLPFLGRVPSVEREVVLLFEYRLNNDVEFEEPVAIASWGTSSVEPVEGIGDCLPDFAGCEGVREAVGAALTSSGGGLTLLLRGTSGWDTL